MKICEVYTYDPGVKERLSYLDGATLDHVFIMDNSFHFEFDNGVELAGKINHIYIPKKEKTDLDQMVWNGVAVYDAHTKKLLGTVIGEPYSDGVETYVNLKEGGSVCVGHIVLSV